MADAPETTPKIDSLRAKVNADPKSRHFYPLAEELRKIGQMEEAENVLRAGLEHHSTYLSAWISLGRVLKDRGAYPEAVDVLMRGLSLDPENVVAAKLIANVHLAMGDKVEAIKKFKLVHALMPADEEAEQMIDRLDREVNPQDYSGATRALTEEAVPGQLDSPEAAPLPDEHVPLDSMEPPFPTDDEHVDQTTGDHEFPEHETSEVPSESPDERTDPGNFDMTNPAPFSLGDLSSAVAAAEIDPVAATQPTEEALETSVEPEPPAPEPDTAGEPELAEESALFADSELPSGPPSISTTPEAGLSDPVEVRLEPEPEPDAEPDAEPVITQRAPSSEDVWASEELSEQGLPPSADTVTMAQILAQQGHTARARDIYEKVLEREPGNEEALEGLASLSRKPELAPSNQRPDRARRLEAWRRKVAR